MVHQTETDCGTCGPAAPDGLPHGRCLRMRDGALSPETDGTWRPASWLKRPALAKLTGTSFGAKLAEDEADAGVADAAPDAGMCSQAGCHHWPILLTQGA